MTICVTPSETFMSHPGGSGRIAARFEGSGLTEDIPELRDQAVQPAQLDDPTLRGFTI